MAFFPPVSFCRKLKKLFRSLKEKTRTPEVHVEQTSRTLRQWNLDYDLEPFVGLTPEYMEMSEWPSLSQSVRNKREKYKEYTLYTFDSGVM